VELATNKRQRLSHVQGMDAYLDIRSAIFSHINRWRRRGRVPAPISEIVNKMLDHVYARPVRVISIFRP
jgi:hypothetical protein